MNYIPIIHSIYHIRLTKTLHISKSLVIREEIRVTCISIRVQYEIMRVHYLTFPLNEIFIEQKIPFRNRIVLQEYGRIGMYYAPLSS